MTARLMLAVAFALGAVAASAGTAGARYESTYGGPAQPSPPNVARPARVASLPLPPNVRIGKTRVAGRVVAAPRSPLALSYWLWRGHACNQQGLFGEPGWWAYTPYAQDPTGQTWVYSRARFFTTPGQVWSEIGTGGPWWIQTTDGSNRYWWWSGSMWQGPFQPNGAYTTSQYDGVTGTNYVAVVTDVYLWTSGGGFNGPYYKLEQAAGEFAMLDPNWACQVYLINV